MSPRSVLVTGGCGFVGRHLVDAFADAGHSVTALDLSCTPWRDDVDYVEADIRDDVRMAAACAGRHTVVHNASLVHTKRHHEDAVWSVNLDGTLRILEACRAHGVRRLVYLSTASAVYEGRDIEHGDESLPYSRVSQAPYADSKIAAEQRVLASNGRTLSTAAIRPHVVFGPHDRRFLPAILQRARDGRMRFSVGRGSWLSDFTYVDNLVDAVLAAEQRLEPGSPVAGQAYFVTNGEPRAFFDFVGDVLAELGLPGPRVAIPFPVAYAAAAVSEAVDALRGGAMHREDRLSRFAVKYLCTHHYFSIDKARRDLDYAPRVDLDEGIRRTVAHLRAGPST